MMIGIACCSNFIAFGSRNIPTCRSPKPLTGFHFLGIANPSKTNKNYHQKYRSVLSTKKPLDLRGFGLSNVFLYGAYLSAGKGTSPPTRLPSADFMSQ